MASFNDSFAGSWAKFFFALSGLLDFPVLAFTSVHTQLSDGKMPSGEMALLQAPFYWKLLWSAAVGVIVALGIDFYRRKAGLKPLDHDDPYKT